MNFSLDIHVVMRYCILVDATIDVNFWIVVQLKMLYLDFKATIDVIIYILRQLHV